MSADTCLTVGPGVASLNPARSHTFVEIDHEIISTAILLPSADSRRVVVSYKRKYVHKILVNYSVKLAQEKSVVRSTHRPDKTIAVDWDVKYQTKPKSLQPLVCSISLFKIVNVALDGCIISVFQCTVNVLKFRTLVACQKGFHKQGRPRSDCF